MDQLKFAGIGFILIGFISFLMMSANARKEGEILGAPDKNEILGTQYVSKVEFQSGEQKLTSDDKMEIASIVNKARASGELDKIKILAWADREYPERGEKVSRGEITLAEKRGEALKNYVTKELSVDEVAVYNMSRRPPQVSEILKTPEARIKKQAEAEGIAPSTFESTVFTHENKRASSALVLVDISTED